MSTYTEEEAKTKWCPFVRQRDAASAGVTAINRHSDGRNIKCIASECMSWRWKARFGTDPENPENCAVLPSTHGYCGLAGRPE